MKKGSLILSLSLAFVMLFAFSSAAFGAEKMVESKNIVEVGHYAAFSNAAKFVKNDEKVQNILRDKKEKNLVNIVTEDAWDNKVIDKADIIAEINGFHLTNDELLFRYNLSVALGGKPTFDYIYNNLIEEKVIFAYAEDLGILPTDKEVNKRIQALQKQALEDKTYQNLINNFINDAGIDIDDYWNVYEFYNEYRMATQGNLNKYLVNQGRSEGLVAPLNASEDEINNYKYGNGDTYYFEKIQLYKKNVTINIFDDQYIPQMDRVYLYKGGSIKGFENAAEAIDNQTTFKYVPDEKIEGMKATNATNYNVSKAVSDTTYFFYANWGLKPYNFVAELCAYQYDERGQQCVSPLDVVLYRTTSYPNGGDSMIVGAFTSNKIYLPSGSAVSITGWNYGSKFSRLTPYGLLYSRYTYGGTYGNSGSYYITVTGFISMIAPEGTVPGGKGFTITTSRF